MDGARVSAVRAAARSPYDETVLLERFHRVQDSGEMLDHQRRPTFAIDAVRKVRHERIRPVR
jgi:hypothetical protein